MLPRPTLGLIAISLLLALSAPSLEAQPTEPLFLHLDVDKVSASLSLAAAELENGMWLEGLLERSYATVDSSILDAIASLSSTTTPSPVLLNVSPSETFVADLVHSRHQRLRIERFTGTIATASTSRVYLGREIPRGSGARATASVQGSVHVDGRRFRLRPVRGQPGLIAIEEMDPTWVLHSPDDSWEPPDISLPAPPPDNQLLSQEITALYLYTNSAQVAHGDSMALLADEAVDSVNWIFESTHLQARLTLVGVEPLNDFQFGGPNDLVFNIDAKTMRQGYGADVVQLLYGPDDSYWNTAPELGGIGAQMDSTNNNHTDFYPWAFSAVRFSVVEGALLPSHELGHNLGACHDLPSVVGACASARIRADGLAFQDPLSQIKTVMHTGVGSFNPSFSSRGVEIGGRVLGDDTKENDLTIAATTGIIQNLEGGPEWSRLTVEKSGSGTGRIVTDDYLIDCGPYCQADYPWGVRRQLRAVADVESYFAGWQGFLCPFESAGEVHLDGNLHCTAIFESLNGALLDATKHGLGDGYMASSPAGIDCPPTTCSSQSAEFDMGQNVTLSADEVEGSEFNGWGGDCVEDSQNARQASVMMDGHRVCEASFDEVGSHQKLLLVRKDGEGAGSAFGPGINCGSDCSEAYTQGSEVTLTAVAAEDSQFDVWWGLGCDGQGTDVVIDMATNRTCTARFNRRSELVEVSKRGNGVGTIVSDPEGIDCGPGCSGQEADFILDSQVVLTASPEQGTSEFNRWFGDCSGTNEQAPPLTINGAKSCEAEFVPANPATLQLVVNVVGEGNPSLTANPGDVSCDSSCNIAYIPGTVVTISHQDDGLNFVRWDGLCEGEPDTAQIVLSESGMCSALFRCDGPPSQCNPE